jgi:hypothetical protein
MASDKKPENIELEDYLEKRDFEANEKTTPPIDEKVKIPALWAFEVYTPSFIESFHKGISKFGWEEDVWSINSDFQHSLDELRSRGSGSGWLNLGYIVNESTKSFWPGTKKAKLPEGIFCIKATLLQLLPSTTIFACQFILSEDLANSIETPLRNTYETYKKPIKNGYIEQNVSHQKEDAVTLTREYLKNLCCSWFSKNFPGLFSSGALDGEFPICELVTFEKFIPFESKFEERKWYGNYISMLKLESDFDSWECEELEGIFLQIDEGMRQDNKYNLVLFGNINKALASVDLKTYGSDKEQQLLSYLAYLDRTFGTWVLFIVAKTFVRSLAKLRDAYGQLDISNYEYSSSFLLKLDHQLLDIQKNTVPFINELKDYCDDEKYFLSDVYEFKPCHEMRKRQKPLFSSIRNVLLNHADLIVRNEKSIRNIAEASRLIASVESSNNLAKTNISLQNRMLWMTVAILLLTMITSLSAINKIIKYFFESSVYKLILDFIQ